ncbi:LuxR family transcriptional regulator [Mycobacterium sp. PS03-16]|uniref:helix-turn-helix transcriptional regulator n=1 Tax=Mycobacterium sp. PS03-16 TaxID=2559611 RepID=UPI0010740ED3|nr:LuxR family transcriptional regulator [Mycobacterium sp. PS03-16]TFV58897.1 LuxR family transcriptional regulator [Mycobacterium sp. PS03-16]
MAGPHPPEQSPLFDREYDLAALDDALARTRAGAGGVLAIEGPAGIGKTMLIDRLRHRAHASGLSVYSARGGEVERDFGFGVVRQLLERALVGVGDAERARLLAGAARLAEPVFSDVAAVKDSGDVAFATLHGLYWLVANLTERGPVVLTVDDAHWADEPSLRFLLHLAHRLGGLPALMVLTVRTGSDRHRPVLGSLMYETGPVILRPQPLSATAVARLVRSRLGATASDELCWACAEATGGNPFLLSELLGEFVRERRSPDAIDPGAVDQVAPDRIAAAVLLRVSRLHPQAPALARAVAVLGGDGGLALCARLAEVTPRTARVIAAGLVDLAVFGPGDPLRFTHPIVRTAIYEEMSTAQRADLHARAARLLADRHADPGAVAVHLMVTDPSGDPDVVDVLREAARAAMAGGAPDTAVALLRRALDEPPGDKELPAVLFELGMAEHEIGDDDAPGHLRRAGQTASDPLGRARAYIALAWTTHPDARRQREQLPLYEEAAADVRAHDREAALELEAARLGALLLNPDLPVRFENEADRVADLPALTAAECLLRSFVARRALEGGPLHMAGDLAEQAAAHPALVSAGGHPLWRTNVTICLVEAERYEVAEHILSRAIRHAEGNGSLQWLARALWLRGLARHRRGDLRGAETDARTSVDLHGMTVDYTKSPGLVVVLDSLADQGRAGEGEALLAQKGMDGDLAPTLFSVLPLIARGRCRAALGDHVRARLDLLDALARMRSSRGMFPWAADAEVALFDVLRAQGDAEGARAVAEHALSAALAAQSRRRIGAALRISGVASGGARGIELLRRAADTLAESPALLWRAQAYVDLGSALRGDGQTARARPVLRDGMDLAHRCGATPLADRAERELRAAGGRPRRRAGTGADALTASERRIVELAASGVSNKEIAQSMFVTLRTVELHLSNAYAKLGIRSRHELATALAN